VHGMRKVMVSLENDEGIELSVTGTLRDVTEISSMELGQIAAGLTEGLAENFEELANDLEPDVNYVYDYEDEEDEV
jgi:hypothetical protein